MEAAWQPNNLEHPFNLLRYNNFICVWFEFIIQSPIDYVFYEEFYFYSSEAPHDTHFNIPIHFFPLRLEGVLEDKMKHFVDGWLPINTQVDDRKCLKFGLTTECEEKRWRIVLNHSRKGLKENVNNLIAVWIEEWGRRKKRFV